MTQGTQGNDETIHYPAYTSELTGNYFAPMDVFLLDGKWWYEHPAPRRWHRCRTYTRALDGAYEIHRCACGAIGDGTYWDERNSRKR